MIKKAICIILVLAFFPFVGSAESFDVFKEAKISVLSANIDLDFSKSAEGENFKDKTWTIYGTGTSVIKEENDNKFVCFAPGNESDYTIDISLGGLSGIVAFSYKVKAENLDNAVAMQMVNVFSETPEGKYAQLMSATTFPSLRVLLKGRDLSQKFIPSEWNEFSWIFDTESKTYSLWFNGKCELNKAALNESTEKIGMIRFMVNGLSSKLCVDDIKVGRRDLTEKERSKIFRDSRPVNSQIKEFRNLNAEEKKEQRIRTEKVINDLNDAIKEGKKEFTIPEGYYRFSSGYSPNLTLKGVENFTIKANGANFILDSVGVPSILDLTNCKNVTIEGMTLDLENLPFTQGVITNIDYDKKRIEMIVDNGYPIPDNSWSNEFNVTSIVTFFDKDTRKVISYGTEDYTLKYENHGKKRISFQFNRGQVFKYNIPVKVGDRLTISRRTPDGIHGISTQHCENITYRNIDLYAASGFGFFENGGKGNHRYENVRYIRRPNTDRLFAGAADGLHSYLTEKGPTLEKVEITSLADDCVNIHGFHSLVYSQISETEVAVSSIFGRDFKEGTNLNFYDCESGDHLASAKVIGFTEVNDKQVLKNAKSFDKEISRQMGIRIRGVKGSEVTIAKLDRPVKVRPFDQVDSDGNCGAGAVIKNSYFHDSRLNGVICHGTGTVVENNVFENLALAGVYMGNGDYHLEAPVPTHVTIKNNTFINVCNAYYGHDILAAIHMRFRPVGLNRVAKPWLRVIHDIDISNNTFKDINISAIRIRHSHDMKIDNNTFDNICTSFKDKSGAVVDIDQSDNVSLRNNKFYNIKPDIINEFTGEMTENIIREG